MTSNRRRIEKLESRTGNQDYKVYHRRDGIYFDRYPWSKEAEAVADQEITGEDLVIDYVKEWGGRRIG